MSHVSHYMDSYPLYTPKGTWYRFEFAEKQSLYPSFFNESMYVNESLYIHCICASQCIYIASMYMNESLYIHCVWVSQCICIEGIYIHWLTRVCDMTHPHTHTQKARTATYREPRIWMSQVKCMKSCHMCLIYIDSLIYAEYGWVNISVFEWVNVNVTCVSFTLTHIESM